MQGAAHLYDGHRARRHAVTVSVSDDRLTLVIVGPTLEAPLRWPLSDLRAGRDHAEPGQIILPRHLHTGDETPHDPARLIVEDPEMVAWLRRTRPALHRVDAPEGTGKRIALRAGAAVAAVLAMIFVILPALAATLADLLPMEREIAFGRGVKAQIERVFASEEGESLDCDAPGGVAALDQMVARLTAGQDLGYPLQVVVFDHEMMNAFAVPGGQIVLMRGLLEGAETPEMVASVLAHEIGHVVHRDPTREALRAAGSAGLLGLLLGDVTGGAALTLVSEQLVNASYGQQAESAADAYALETMAKAGLPPESLADMFETFRDEYGDVSGPMAHFLSHPRLADRIEAARAARPGADRGPVLNAAQWQALREICAP